jgi:RNAse (barnase) inhibitor barstar
MTSLTRRLSQTSWECVHFVANGVATDSLALQQANERAVVGYMDGASIDSQEELLRALAAAFRFPDYFGGNWDAVDECLRDLEWLPASEYLLVVTSSTHLWQRLPQEAGLLVQAWLFAAESWGRTNTPFHLVFEW